MQDRFSMRTLFSLIGAGFALGCAATTPSPPLPRDVLVVLNAQSASLSLIPIQGFGSPQVVPLGAIGGTPYALTGRGSEVLVTTGVGSTVARLDLESGVSSMVYRLPTGSGAGGAVFVNDTLAFVTNPFVDRVPRFNFATGDTVSVAVGHSPVAVAFTRGRVFVVNANLDPSCSFADPCVLGPSWLTVLDPISTMVLDSIPLVGPGNAVAIEVGGDGQLYVLSAGVNDGEASSGRVSIIDPIARSEVGSFAGFGILPNNLASDRRERLFVTSETEGLMEFNTRTRRIVRGAGSGIPRQGATAAAVDGEGLIYAIESGSCSSLVSGRVRVFRSDLTEVRVVLTGTCSIAATQVKLPPIVE
jgi:DNA-binding beta-propeller fold protein YncE